MTKFKRKFDERFPRELIGRCGVYALTYDGTAVYVGSTLDLRRRVLSHFAALESGKHPIEPLLTLYQSNPHQLGYKILAYCPEDQRVHLEGAYHKMLPNLCNRRPEHMSMSEYMRIRNQDPTMRKRMSDAAKARFSDPVEQKKQSERQKARFQKPDEREKLLARRPLFEERRVQAYKATVARKSPEEKAAALAKAWVRRRATTESTGNE